MNCAIVYAIKSKMHRRCSIVEHGDIDEAAIVRTLAKGEDYFLLDNPTYDVSPEFLHSAIARHCGISVEEVGDAHCAFVDPETSLVKGFLMADADIDAYPPFTLVNVDPRLGVAENWLHVDSKFIPRIISIDPSGTVVDERWVDPSTLSSNSSVTFLIDSEIPIGTVLPEYAHRNDASEGTKKL